MPVALGSTAVVAAAIGSTEINRIYVGASLVFDLGGGFVPTYVLMPQHSEGLLTIQASDNNELLPGSDYGYRQVEIRPDLTVGATVDDSVVLWDDVAQAGVGSIVGDPYSAQGDGFRCTSIAEYGLAPLPTPSAVAFTIGCRVEINTDLGRQGYLTPDLVTGDGVELSQRTGPELLRANIQVGGVTTLIDATGSFPDGTLAWAFLTCDASGGITMDVRRASDGVSIASGSGSVSPAPAIGGVNHRFGAIKVSNTDYNGTPGVQVLVWDGVLTAGEQSDVATGTERDPGGKLLSDFVGVRQPGRDISDPTRLLTFAAGGAGYPLVASLPAPQSPGYSAPLADDPTTQDIYYVIACSASGWRAPHTGGRPGPYGRIQFVDGWLHPGDVDVDGYSLIRELDSGPGGPDDPNAWAIEGYLAAEYAQRDDVVLRVLKMGQGGTALAALNAGAFTDGRALLATASDWDVSGTNVTVCLHSGGADINTGVTKAQMIIDLEEWRADFMAIAPNAHFVVSLIHRPDLDPTQEAVIQSAQTDFAAAYANVSLVDETCDTDGSGHFLGTVEGMIKISRAIQLAAVAAGSLAPSVRLS